MSEFKEYRLGEIAEIQNGYAFKSSEFAKKGVPIIKIKNIVPPNVVFDEVQFFNNDITTKLEKFVVKKKDFLISMTGSTVNQMASAVGKMARYGFSTPSLMNQRVAKIYSISDKVTDDYLFYYLNRFDVQYELASRASGSANQANISPEQLKSYLVKVPDIETQKKIAEILSSLDDKIELNNKINQELESIAQLLFKRWFVYFEFPNEKGEPYKSSGGEMIESELGVIPKGWEVKSFSDVSEIKLGGTPSSMKVEYWGGEIPWVNSGELNKNFIIEGAKGITELGLKKSATKLIPKYSTLIAITGATLGQVSYSFIDACYNQSVVSITSDIQLNEYIHQYVLCNIKVIISHQTGGAQQHINKGDVEKTNIIIPNPIVLAHFSEMISLVYRKIENSLFENQELSKLRDSLLPKLISGKLQLNDN